MSNYKVPEEGLKAALGSKGAGFALELGCVEQVKLALEAFIRWQSENPRVPTDAELDALMEEYIAQETEGNSNRYIIVEWVRRMYLAEPVKTFLFNGIPVREDPTLKPGEWRWETPEPNMPTYCTHGTRHSFNPAHRNCPGCEPEVPEEPEEIADLLNNLEPARMGVTYSSARTLGIEAFRRGQKVNEELLRCAKLALKSFEDNWTINWDDLRRAIEAAEKEAGK